LTIVGSIFPTISGLKIVVLKVFLVVGKVFPTISELEIVVLKVFLVVTNIFPTISRLKIVVGSVFPTISELEIVVLKVFLVVGKAFQVGKAVFPIGGKEFQAVFIFQKLWHVIGFLPARKDALATGHVGPPESFTFGIIKP
jgi:hypothetical protein